MSQVVSSIGGQLQQFTTTWQIFLLTGSALQIGLTGVARAVPILCFSLIGGVVADRFDRRRMIIFTQIMTGLTSLFLGIDTLTGSIQVWHVYAITFVNSSMMALSGPGRRAIIASLVPRTELMNAMALNQNVMQLSRIFAPSLAGVLVTVVGLPFSYFFNGMTHVVTALTLYVIRIAPLPPRPASTAAQDLMEGLAFVRRRSIILALLGTDFAAMLFGSFQPLLPIIADRFGYGPTGFGLLVSAPSMGAVLGAMLVMSLGDIRYKGYLIVGAILGYCVLLIALAVTPWFWMAMVVIAGLGFADALQSTPRNAVIQLVTPDGLRGRVSAFQGMLVTGGPGLGQTMMGGLSAALGVPFALIAGGLACAAVNLGVLASRPDLRARDLAMDVDEEDLVAYGAARPGAPASTAPS
jgi:MFS family permease